MSDQSIKHISKFLTLILRHQPEVIGIKLTEDGWANIDTLIELSSEHGKDFSRELLLRVVYENDKQRFAISEDGQFIRANQGHSISVDLGLASQTPPAQLFHGTVDKFLKSITQQGLLPGSRQHVHLSADQQTAKIVGSRRGKPVVLVVDSAGMAKAGIVFYRSLNGVWLTDQVPADYLQFPERV